MPMLVRSQQSDGLIVGVWSASTEGLLRAQVVDPDPLSRYLLLPSQQPHRVQEQYLVVADALVPKPLVTLTATPNPFAADGTTICTVSVVPFVPCTVLVDATPYTLVSEDPAILLSAEAPAHFRVSLAHQAACWGAPLIVEAV